MENIASAKSSKAILRRSVAAPPARLLRHSAFAVGLVGASLVGMGALDRAIHGRPDRARRPSLVISSSIEDAGTLGLHERRRVTFSISNLKGFRHVRIIGVSEACSKEGCITIKTPLPLTIARGHQVDLEVEYKAMAVGRHAKELCIYTDCSDGGIVPLIIRAVVVPAAEPPR